MKKHTRVFFLSLALIFALSISVCASTWLASVTPRLSFSGSQANCYVYIRETGAKINATLELWNGSILVDSWSKSGTSVVLISESHAVTSGKTYTLKVTGTIDGVSISSTPVQATCP